MSLETLLYFVPAALIGYWVKRRAYLGPLDPLQLVAISEGVWAATVFGLADQGDATSLQVSLFATTLGLWWFAWLAFASLYGVAYRIAVTRFFVRLAGLPKRKARALIGLTVVVSTIVFIASQASGGGGDNRLAVMKVLRPLEGATTILPPIALFLLLVARGRWSKVMLAVLLGEAIATGGKSAILQVLLPLAAANLTGHLKIGKRFYVATIAVLALGFFVSTYLNYGTTNPVDSIELLALRISLDGDVYILSLPNDLAAQVQTTSLSTYLLGPYLKALFVPVAIDENIGSQIGSIIQGFDTPNGPNPHWPIVLYAYHVGVGQAIALSVVCFAAMLGLKFWITTTRQGRTAPAWIAIPMTSFCLQYPQTFFADPTFPSIYLVQAAFVALILRLCLRTTWHRAPHAHDRYRIA